MFGLEVEFIERIIKFGIVGSISFVIDFGLTWFCKEKLKFNKFIANAIGFLVSVVVNFSLNRIWTFQSSSNDVEMQFIKFFTVATFALMLNTIIIYVLNVKIRFNFYLSKLIAVFMVMSFNYSMNAYFTFVAEEKPVVSHTSNNSKFLHSVIALCP